MKDWEMTATTVYCDAVKDEVTLMVKSDGTSTCTGYRKYTEPTRETARLVRIKSKRLGKQLSCVGQECDIVIEYRDRLLSK